MMIRDASKNREQIQLLSLDDLVPQNHLVRKLEAAIDWSFIYDLVEEKYSDNTGRPSLDPVTLIKLPILQYMFGIRSMRQTVKEVEVNAAYRWFLGLDLQDPVPHFSTFGKNYTRRFKDTDLFEQIFQHILSECFKAGLVDSSVVFVDSTHVKARANSKKFHDEIATEQAQWYEKELLELEHLDIDIVVGDSAYKTPAIAKLLEDQEIKLLSAYKRPQTKEGFFKKAEFVYDEFYDCYLCPNDQVLPYSTTDREGYRQYKSNPQVCAGCPYLQQCTESKDHQKTVTRHVWAEPLERAVENEYTPGIRELYKLRKETIERVFALAKELHGFRYTQEYGRARMELKSALTFACMNLKKLAKKRWRNRPIPASLLYFLRLFTNFSNIRAVNPLLA